MKKNRKQLHKFFQDHIWVLPIVGLFLLLLFPLTFLVLYVCGNWDDIVKDISDLFRDIIDAITLNFE